MTYVLAHGATFAASCWDLLVPHLDDDVIAIDLPGRGSRPADLSRVAIAEFVAAVLAEIEAWDLRDVVLVGHSLAGITLPGVAVPSPAPPINRTIVGDLAAVDFDEATAGVQAQLDDLGNSITDPAR